MLGEVLGEDLSFREKVVAMSTMLSLIDLNVITPPPYKQTIKISQQCFWESRSYFFVKFNEMYLTRHAIN